MSILVTRPSPAGEQLVARLRSLGREAWHFPLIEFSPGRELAQLPAALAGLRPGDLGFVLSQHAVEYARRALSHSGQPWPGHVQWFAIGRTTALAFHNVTGLDIRYPQDREISEVLLQLPELQNIAGKRALILRGNGGRELLGTTLAARGAEIAYSECYQRSPRHYNGAQEAHRWQQRGIRTLIVTSGEMLRQLYTLTPEWYRHNWLLTCQLVVVSERLACLARELGWRDIQVADNADNDALLRALPSQ
ncbi:uroporphyrinogen-III synthase [Shimwellia blattae]|uniref:Uroporphyrinogen-III synthase n=1 Tax=Shimwellia blattae (strain ATCC 29907 / DSM 4481 / JCM 1650 / NBRC 105725 / CDC 9005-74) TaxID=630626 RepID=I2BE66_SHIBC|nr:uroporphyrinogen-III synthase [Shimwellia blattae]AFJ48820.1 uroporphyrinogen III synthase [Shimwellia blattae DSM 4481 = NBRC 105725]GAB82601.1 uroporphyrinogen-III synthase [Shimwellia blattae DSM 4481 = NBRC 105725]VDY66306.1 uroporphyrinogen-III synthase [Shimwellia blattae]VEC27737.1 uroporphyrinogen-III synthase [Shimwellia blattae]